ncbi:MAG: transglutaminase-like domain-containing protein, partial [Bacteroidota bacterium]
GIESHVREKLISLGGDGIPRLEEAWEKESDSLIQGRIEDIIHHIQTQGTLEGLLAWKEVSTASFLKGWFLVSQYQFPALDFLDYKNKINRIVHRTWLEIRSGMNLPEKLGVLNRMLYTLEKFKPNRKDVFDPNNYFLHTLLDTKKGGPISMGLLYLHLCEELEMPLGGIVLPGYFLVMYQDDNTEFFIDPFNKGTFYTRKDLDRFLKELKVSDADKEKYMKPSSRSQILAELIRSLKVCYEKKEKNEKADKWRRLGEDFR